MAALTTMAIAGATAAGLGASTAVALGTAGLGLMAGQSFNQQQAAKKEAKKTKAEIARQRGVAEEKRGSLIRQQRRQLGGGKGIYSLSETGNTGLASQSQDEVLG